MGLENLQHRRNLLLKCPCCLGELRNISAKFLERRQLTPTDFVPMALMDAKQFDQQQYRLVFSQAMPLAPCDDGLHEFLVDVALVCLRHPRYCVGQQESVASPITEATQR